MNSDLFTNTYKPDVLSCIADLSNDEVFTPPEVANKMLDMLPQELFRNPETKFLDPACKSGVFLREIAKRLIGGLADKIPNLQERCDWIFHNQLYGIAITEITSLLSRRSVYCSKYPNSKFSISIFDDVQGNILFHKIRHTWQKGKCIFCGTGESGQLNDISREGLETHAYEFIHTLHPEEIFDMKFDVIISNPPYQLDDGGNGASAIPIYQHFIEQAKKLNPRYMSMIIPSRWFAGGKGLDDFRKTMLSDKRIVKLVDYSNAKDCFPGISLGGGVCYFLWSRDEQSLCEFTNIHDGKRSTQLRNLNEFPVFVRYNEAISIIHKVKAKSTKSIDCVVESRNPFGFSSSARGEENQRSFNDCLLISSGGSGYVPLGSITKGKDILSKFKVIISKVTSEHAGEPDKSGMFNVVSTIRILKPNEICTDSYLVIFSTDKEKEAVNFANYVCTKFFRFLLLQAVSSINLSQEKFQFVPMLDFAKKWNDQILYKQYGLNNDEVGFIESLIREKSIEE